MGTVWFHNFTMSLSRIMSTNWMILDQDPHHFRPAKLTYKIIMKIKLVFPHDFLKEYQNLEVVDDFSTISDTTLKEYQILQAPIDCLNQPETAEDVPYLPILLTPEVTIQAKESIKKKNTPYLLKEDLITTKPMTPVSFVVSGAKPGQFIEVSMRYSENPNQNKPVTVCKLHQDCEICKNNQRDHPKNFNFCIYQPEKFSCQYLLMDGHPTAVLTLTHDVISEDGKVLFDIIFPCLNSCNIHRSYGKKLDLILTIFDREKNQLGNPIQFHVRVCKNVKRDHVDDEHSTASKRMRKSIKEEVVSYKNIQTADVAHYEVGPNDTASGTQEQDARTWICFSIKNEDHQKQVVSMIKDLDGEVFSFDDPGMTLV
ncbi:uncharacterized protein LOC119572144 [Penaeus monodon]|uniref:uncharacterized protein LOC119572144 n=1 Tax=Penaeus monodon TaxID=6687 RepID=UPI0018A785F0|nr:uncharacterized protein LOC119572144 [Penaeus monodon]